jgi:hypothetical protein
MMTTERVELTTATILVAVKTANEAPYTVTRSYGCGRAYVCVGSNSKKEVNAIAAACKKLGLMFLRKAYGTSGPCIYIGYDNSDGRALSKARAFADSLKASGLRAYDDAVED